jgi:hypothetical protein
VLFNDYNETLKIEKEIADGPKQRHTRFLRETTTEKTSYLCMQVQGRKYIDEIEVVETLYRSI